MLQHITQVGGQPRSEFSALMYIMMEAYNDHPNFLISFGLQALFHQGNARNMKALFLM
jgi:hypothetical protein